MLGNDEVSKGRGTGVGREVDVRVQIGAGGLFGGARCGFRALVRCSVRAVVCVCSARFPAPLLPVRAPPLVER